MLRLIGIGSPHGDDQIGWRLVEELAQLRRADIQAACLPEARLESGNWGTLRLSSRSEDPGRPGECLRASVGSATRRTVALRASV
jgi:hypothetical protein